MFKLSLAQRIRILRPSIAEDASTPFLSFSFCLSLFSMLWGPDRITHEPWVLLTPHHLAFVPEGPSRLSRGLCQDSEAGWGVGRDWASLFEPLPNASMWNRAFLAFRYHLSLELVF